MRKTAIACLTVFLSTTANSAEVCQSLPDAAAGFKAANITKEQIISITDADLAGAYLSKSGIAVPETSHPIGLIFVTGPKGVIIGIVEQEFCIRSLTVIPLEAHRKALDSLFRAA